jgi:sugar phosphate isomerase/epimerase
MSILHDRIALHTWTLDTTPLGAALRVARDAGYNGVELRHVDFMRCRKSGLDELAIVQLVRDSGMRVTQVGTENGVLFESGGELKRLLGSLRYVCEKAAAFDCDVVMMPPGAVSAGATHSPEDRLATCAEIAAEHGLRLALEFNSRHPIVNTLAAGLALVEAVNRNNCGLLLDTYHLQRSGGDAASFKDVPVEKIMSFQFSDVPHGPPPDMGVPIDRLPPGEGVVPFAPIFRMLMAMRYQGYLSYEAPNPQQWSRPAKVVAREGLERVRALLTQAELPE